jgi:glutamate synthase (NADPH/NADH) small chain
MTERPDLSPKERMQIERHDVPARSAVIRSMDFNEVNLGYSQALAMEEAERCLDCRNPRCIDGCPVRVNIPQFITHLAEGDLHQAAESLLDDNALPCVTGRVCPQETQCEGLCIRGKKDELEAKVDPDTGRRVAIVGSGPAGLTAAGELAKTGHKVTVFEAFHAPGGVLIYGIPEFRLPKDIVQKEVDRLKDLGVTIEVNAIVGKTWTLRELRQDFDAVFLAVGAGLPVFMDIPGEELKGVYSANEYLTRVNLMGAFREDTDTPVLHGQKVVVVGGGNVAMDAVRTARRLGAKEAIIAYRRGKDELPARAEEVHHAEEEGVKFELMAAPTRIIGNEEGWVTGIECQMMELGEADASGRRRPAPIPDSEYVIDCDMVVVAIGTRSNPMLTSSEPDLKINEWGYLIVDEDGMTSVPGIFAGGDIVRGAATVILAMGDGKRAARAIEKYLGSVQDLLPAAVAEATAGGESPLQP